MKTLRISILLTIIFFSCSHKKENKILIEPKYESKINNKKYNRFWITYQYPNNKEEKVEVYLTKEKDTLFNQFNTYYNGILDSSKSRFYEVNLIKSKNKDTYKGTLRYFSEHESNPKNIHEKKSLTLSIFQKSRDSFYFQSFESIASNRIQFELINYKDNQLAGILTEIRVIENERAGKDMVDVIRTQIPIDNKRQTHNMAIEVYQSN